MEIKTSSSGRVSITIYGNLDLSLTKSIYSDIGVSLRPYMESADLIKGVFIAIFGNKGVSLSLYRDMQVVRCVLISVYEKMSVHMSISVPAVCNGRVLSAIYGYLGMLANHYRKTRVVLSGCVFITIY